jgi:hypothetical protein
MRQKPAVMPEMLALPPGIDADQSGCGGLGYLGGVGSAIMFHASRM